MSRARILTSVPKREGALARIEKKKGGIIRIEWEKKGEGSRCFQLSSLI